MMPVESRLQDEMRSCAVELRQLAYTLQNGVGEHDLLRLSERMRAAADNGSPQRGLVSLSARRFRRATLARRLGRLAVVGRQLLRAVFELAASMMNCLRAAAGEGIEFCDRSFFLDLGFGSSFVGHVAHVLGDRDRLAAVLIGEPGRVVSCWRKSASLLGGVGGRRTPAPPRPIMAATLSSISRRFMVPESSKVAVRAQPVSAHLSPWHGTSSASVNDDVALPTRRFDPASRISRRVRRRPRSTATPALRAGAARRRHRATVPPGPRRP